MGTHLRAYRLRCYPSRDQRAMLSRLFGAGRWVWNQCLQARSSAYADPELKALFGRGLSITSIDFSRVLTELKKQPETTWLSEVDSAVLSQSLRDQDRAFSNFFAGRARYPRFKRRGGHQSVRVAFDQRHSGKVKAWKAGRLVLPQLGDVDVVWSRRPSEMPKMVTVSRDTAGRYFVSMAVEEWIEEAPEATMALGVDVGIKSLAVLSDGTKIANPKKLRCRLRHLRRLARGLSRKKKGSGRWRRAQRKIARLHAKIGDARRDVLHQATTSIICRAGLIAIEDLNVIGMMRNRRVARAFADASISEFHRQLDYKAKWHGRELVRVDRWEPTSQLCSTEGCCYRHLNLTLRDRTWHCPACGTKHDRDVNAAKNILAGGLRAIAGSGVGQGVPELMRVEGGQPSRRRQKPGRRGCPMKREPDGTPIRAAKRGAAGR